MLMWVDCRFVNTQVNGVPVPRRWRNEAHAGYPFDTFCARWPEVVEKFPDIVKSAKAGASGEWEVVVSTAELNVKICPWRDKVGIMWWVEQCGDFLREMTEQEQVSYVRYQSEVYNPEYHSRPAVVDGKPYGFPGKYVFGDYRVR